MKSNSRRQHRIILFCVGLLLALFLGLAGLAYQEKLDPYSFLEAIGWGEKPGSRLIFPESGVGSPLLPRSADNRRSGLINMLRSDRFATSALLIPGGQDVDAIPLILIHGLMSTPNMWNRVVRDLRSDPELAERYQFWFFYYPTGQPIPLSALHLRETLERAVELGLARRPMVLVGHSMGGILARAQAVTFEPDDAEAILPGVTALDRSQVVQRALIFRARTDVSRLIFIATPHRGTEFTSRGISKLGHHLIRVPDWLDAEVASFYEALPQLGGRRFPTSILGLSPSSSFLRQIHEAPMVAPAHSIIPILGDPSSPFAHDRIVPLWSSSTAAAESELIIPGDHGAFDTPESLNELRRILRAHVGLRPSVDTTGGN